MNGQRSGAACAVGALLGVLAACGPESTIVGPLGNHEAEGIAYIEVAGPSPSTEVGATLQLTATAYCLHDMAVEEARIVWSTATEDLVEVDETGRVTALKSGLAVIRADSEGARGVFVITVRPYGQTIGPEGGEIVYKDGRVAILVDEGTLDEPTRLSVEEVYHSVPGSGSGASRLLPGSVYRFEPDGFAFDEPVGLLFRYDPAGLPEGFDPQRFRVHRLEGDAWIPLDVSVVDQDASTVVGWTSGFSVYGVLDYRPPAKTVSVTPSEALLPVGSHLRLSAVVLEESGEEILAPDVVWSSTDPGVALVDASGEVVALGPGWASVVAVSGDARAEVPVAVYMELGDLSVAPSELWIAVGEARHLDVSLQDPSGAPVHQTVTWTSQDPAVAGVSEEGDVHGVTLGTTMVRVESGGLAREVVVHVTAAPVAVEISPEAGYYVVGVPVQFSALVVDAEHNDLHRPVTWSASDPGALIAPGLVDVSAPRTVILTATSEWLSATVVLIFVAEEDLPGSVELAPPTIEMKMGEVVVVEATVRDHFGKVLPSAVVTWSSGDPGVAMVDQSGTVTGVMQGATLLIARSGRAVGIAEVTVGPRGSGGPPSSIELWPRSPALQPGGTFQIFATVYDENGQAMESPAVVWESRDETVTTVVDGLLTGVASGSTVVTATYGGVADSVQVTVDDYAGGGGGTHDEGLGNNLSWPVVFTEGYGVTGLPVATDPGLRPTADEGIQVTALPFFSATNVPDYMFGGTEYYLQKGPNTWRAEWMDGAGATQPAEVTWGDNLTHHTFTTHAMIRVEVALSAMDVGPLVGYAMTPLYGQGPNEVQGTDGSTVVLTPSLYSVAPRLTIEKLDNETLDPVFSAFDGSVAEGFGSAGPGSFGAEINVAGKVIYGFNLRVRDIAVPAGVDKYGWWRLTFSLDQSASLDGVSVPRGLILERCGNTAVTSVDEELTYTPVLDPVLQRTVLDIWIASASGGGGGGGHGGGGSGGHSEGGCGG